MLRVRSAQDFAAGILFMLIGLAGVVFGGNLVYGTAVRMGPGFFPIWVSWIIVVLGVIVACRGLVFAGPRIEMPVFRPVFFIIASIVIFGLLINRIGLALTTVVLTILAAYARPKVELKETIIFAIVLGIAATLAFVYGLAQPVPAWWGGL
jgi:hypothetical protein